MGKILRTLIIIVMLPAELIGAVLREVASSIRMVGWVWQGDTFVEAILRELTYRGGEIENKKDQARDLAEKFRL